jgi:hypothetical protein
MHAWCSVQLNRGGQNAADQLRVRDQGLHDPQGPLISVGDDGIGAVVAGDLAGRA